MKQPEAASIRVKRVDSRMIIEVKGSHIVLSQVKPRIEKILKTSTVQEVRVFAVESLIVDADLPRSVWHGRNLVVVANEITVSATVNWDTSGEDSIGSCTNAGTLEEEGMGRDGMDGYPGESGGNIMVLANIVQNPDRLTIISNGGNGTCGQDGGDGKDGADGKGISWAEYVDKFPDYLVLSGEIRYTTRAKIINNLMDMSENVKFSKFADFSDTDVYIEVVTPDGSPGQRGKPGGLNGLGGQGGFPGEITVTRLDDGLTFDIKTQKNWGKDGDNGKGGLWGGHGKNGWDICYWGLGLFSKTIYGSDQNSKLKVSYYDEDSSNRIFCAYKALNSTFAYADIEESKIDYSLSSEFRETNNEERKERQHHSKAIGKKSIPRQRVVASFTEYLHEMGKQKQQWEIKKQELEDQRIEKEKQALEKQRIEHEKQPLAQKLFVQEEHQLGEQDVDLLEFNVLQQDIESQNTDSGKLMDLTITRYVNFSLDTNDYNKFESVVLNSSVPEENENKLFDILNNNLNLNDWLQLKHRFVDLSELKALANLFETLKPKFFTSMDKNVNEKIARTLNVKYKLAILREITKQLPSSQTETKIIELTSQNATRYLEETEDKDDSFYHSVLGTLQQYIFENTSAKRSNFTTFAASGLKYTDNAVKQAIKTLILEMNSSNTANEHVKQFYHEYLDYREDQQSNIDAITESLKEELKKPMHQEAFRLWNANVDNDVLPEDLQKMIRKDKALSSLYNQLTREKNAEYDWGKCCANEQVQQIFKENLEQKGITSKIYRVLLAYVYDVNIRVYTRDDDNEIILLEDHNPTSATATHILLKTNELFQLKINNAYRKLEEERLVNDKTYRNILSKIGTLLNINDFENYLEKKLYLANHFENEKPFEELDEKATITKIAAFFPAEERELISQRLKNISPQYTGQHGVFESLLEHFSFEGRHVSFNELCFLINSILSHTVEARQERYIYAWIISAYNQCNWTDELVLLQLENCFKKQIEDKPKWRNYMSNIHNKGVLLVFVAQFSRKPCSAECVEDILHQLSNISVESVCLDQLELTEWPYVLKEYYWMSKLKSLLIWINESETLTSATFFILSIENTYGDKMMEMLFEALKSKCEYLTVDVMICILSSFHAEKWSLCMDDVNDLKQSSLKTWIEHMEEKFKINLEELDVTQIATVIKGNENTSNKIKDHLVLAESTVKIIKQNQAIFNGKLISSFTNGNIKDYAANFKKKKTGSNDGMYEQMLAVVDRAIELKRGFRLRDTQRLTVLSLLLNDNKTLAQVSTGEGKSLIVVAIAIIKGLLGEKVDIITSSPVLAQRDANDNQDIYELFGLSAFHNCSENMEERKDAYSQNQIMYGDLANFQRDYLLDRFYGKHVLGDRSFETVIVDEVDSMLLDKGNNILYLSHDIAGMDKLESVYVYIWQMVNLPTDLTEDEVVETIKRTVLSDVYSSVQNEDIKSLDTALEKNNVLGLWKRLVDSGIISESGRLLIEEIDSNKLQETLSPDFTQYRDRLSYLLRSRIEQKSNVKVPNFLKPFVERHLEGWISSALSALYMVPGEYYVVDIDRSGTSADRHANVIILDRDTGTDQVSSQWDEALHQFLQLKHGCKLSTQTLKAVFISNVTYFKTYKQLYGLTGTLGSQRERHLLAEIHQVDFVTIPPHKTKQFEEYESIICAGRETWKESVRQEVEKLTTVDKRSVLIICETINEVEMLQLAMSSSYRSNLHTYVRNYEKFSIAEGKLKPGQIIIATNLAGRGMDIKISKELEQAGGLHVILTFLPANIRIEEQAYGRAARKGEKGSGRMIVMVKDGQTLNRSTIFTLKKKRNVDELFRISAIKFYYETSIKTEEDCFKAFNELYDKKLKCLADADTPEPVKEVLLQSCLDKWSFWLDENDALIRRSSDEASKRQVKLLLYQFVAQFAGLKASDTNSWPAWVERKPMQMIKLAKNIAQLKSNHYDCLTALRLFEKVIENEPEFCEAAYYYRGYTRSLGDMNIEGFKYDLRMAERLFEEHLKSNMYAAGVVGKLKTSTLQVEGYEEQKKRLINLYSLFIQSINDMLGHAVSPDTFVNDEITEDVAGKIFEDLLQIGMIKKAKIVSNGSDAQLLKFHSDFGISVETLKEFLASHVGTVDAKELLGAIRSSFSLPARSEFWDALIKQDVLHSVAEYVAINEERLKTMNPALMNDIEEKLGTGDMVKADLKLEKNQILLIHEQHWLTYFEKKKLIDVIDESRYKIIEEKGLLLFNKKATIDKSKIVDCVFSTFDSITAEDIINKMRITTSEANIIIDELLKQKVLEQRGDAFALTVNYDQDILLPTCPMYENIIRSVLASCFAYRLALRKIAQQLEDEECSEICIELKSHPYMELLNDLLEQKLIHPPSLSDTFDVDDAVKKVCEMQQFSKDSTKANHIKNVLNRLKSTLAALEEPTGNLYSMMHLFEKENFGNIDEMRIFITNGLEHLLQLAEKKWTVNMLINTFIVTCIGLAQIVMGAVISICSAGILTNVAGAFIGEGVSDIMFAIHAGISGRFSWQDYGKEKLKSLLITVCTAGVGSFYNAARRLLQHGGRTMLKSTVQQLLKASGGRAVFKEIAKQMVKKTVISVSFAVGHMAFDKIAIDRLQTKLNSLASDVLSGVRKEVTDHKVKESLQKAYDTMDESDCKTLVNELTNKYMIVQITSSSFLPVVRQVFQVVNKLMRNVSEEMDTASSTMVLLNRIILVMGSVDSDTQLVKMRNATRKLLDSVNSEIERKLTNIEQNSVPPTKEQAKGKDFERFHKEVIEQWETILSEYVLQLLTKHIVQPVLKTGMSIVGEYVSKALRDIRQSMAELELSREMQRLKGLHEQKMIRPDMTAKTKRQLTGVYHGQLLTIVRKTRSRALFASIIRENVPMDMTLASVCTPVVHQWLQTLNPAITGLTITVHGEKGMTQSFSSGTDGPEIHMMLTNNLFTVSPVDESPLDIPENSALHGALAMALPDLQLIGQKAFRTLLGDYIENNKSMHQHIRQGWHRGLNNKNKSISIVYVPREFHLKSRFKQTFRFAGVLKKVSKQTRLTVDKIIEKQANSHKGESEKISEEGPERVYVVRVSISVELKVKNADLFQKITKLANHTQLTDKIGNDLSNIDEAIDDNQPAWLMNLATIDYTKGLKPQSRELIQKIKDNHVKIYDESIKTLKIKEVDESLLLEGRMRCSKELKVLENAKHAVMNSKIEDLYEFGRQGYVGYETKNDKKTITLTP